MAQITCTCPVCNQPSEYPARYAHKWHRCRGGCRAIGTRMVIVPGGTGVLADAVEAEWRDAIGRGRRLRYGAALAAACLIPTPFWAGAVGLPHLPALVVGGLGAGLAAWGITAARTYACPRPAGL